MNILAVSGSLQSNSSNTALVRLAAAKSNRETRVRVYDGLAELPYFNPDLDGDAPPESVVRFRARAGVADGLLIASPEYAHEMPGVLKNSLDWLVRSGELYGKPVAVLSAAPSRERGAYAREALQRTLEAQGARVVMSSTVAMPRIRSSTQEPDAEADRAVALALDSLTHAVTASPSLLQHTETAPGAPPFRPQ